MDTIHIVMSSSELFVNYMIVSIWSFLTCADPSTQYRLSVLNCNFGDATISKCRDCLSSWSNLELEFLNIAKYAEKYSLSLETLASLPTCYSLLSMELFPTEEKVLSLDCDIIVKKNLRELWNTSLDGFILAAVIDADFNGQYNSRNPKYMKYYNSIGGLREPFSYVQAGVVLYNLAALRNEFINGELFVKAISGKLKFDDQDVINLCCSGGIKLLDMRWNVLHNNMGYRVPYIISLSEDSIKKQYLISRDDPWIIHYAGNQKPWADANCDFSAEFWFVAEQTPIFSDLKTEESICKSKHCNSIKSFIRRGGRFARFIYFRAILFFRSTF